MQGARRFKWPAVLEQNILVRLVVYYLALGLIAGLTWWLAPPGLREKLSSTMAELTSSNLADTFDAVTGRKPKFDSVALASHSPPLTTAVTVVSAFLLVLPVAWVYMFTRHKKGYRQSLVQSLILLPITVATVVVLVKNSLPLAFSLAGIVAAVRFRNTLEDSKDAVFFFAVTGLGLASAVHIDVAVVWSVVFNTVALTLWYTNFGRTPPRLEEQRAERHLQEAMSIANRTSQFVARIDREVLDDMAPEQLDALAVRVRRKRERSTEEMSGSKPTKFDTRFLIHCSDAAAGRPIIESVMSRNVKRWEFERLEPQDDGTAIVVYRIRYRKNVPPHIVTQALEQEGVPFVAGVEVNPIGADDGEP